MLAVAKVPDILKNKIYNKIEERNVETSNVSTITADQSSGS